MRRLASVYGWRDEVLVEDPLGSPLRTARVLSSTPTGGYIVWFGGPDLPIRVMGPTQGRYFKSPDRDQPSISGRRAMLADLLEVEGRRKGAEGFTAGTRSSCARRKTVYASGVTIDTKDIEDQLLSMGVGASGRFGAVKVMRTARSEWLVAGSGFAKEFSAVFMAARWIALLYADEAGF